MRHFSKNFLYILDKIVLKCVFFFLLLPPKGQLISKRLLCILNSPTKRTKKFDFTTMIPQVDLVLFVFWEKLKAPKRPFKINWPLCCRNKALNNSDFG